MSEPKPASPPLDDLVAPPAEAARFWEPEAETDERDERTFFRAKLLRSVRQFVRDNGPLAAMFAVVFVNLVGFGIVVPLMTFFADSLNADPWQVTLMFTSYSLGQCVAEPFFGRLSDRMGRKPILVITTALSVLFYIALAFSPNIWVAIAIRFFSGLSSGNISTIQSYVSDVSRPEQRATRMSLIGAAFSLGFVVGPFIGSAFPFEGNATPFRMPLFAAAALSAVAAIGVLLFVRETRLRSQSHSKPQPDLMVTAAEAIKSPVIVRVILATLCYMGALAGLESTFTMWAHARYNWGPHQIGAIFLFIGIAGAIMQMVLMRPLVRRHGESRVLAAGLFLFGLSFVLQGVNHSQWMITPLVMLGTLGQAVIFSSICAIISLSTPADRQGAMLGLNMATGAIGRITGPMFAGFFYSTLGHDAPLYMGAALTMPAAILALQVGRLRKSAVV